MLAKYFQVILNAMIFVHSFLHFFQASIFETEKQELERKLDEAVKEAERSQKVRG